MLTVGSSFVDLRPIEGPSNSGLFFDSLTEQVCVVRTEGNESVFKVTSLNSSGFTFRTRERGHIRTVCFSPDCQFASIQQEDTVVDFLLLSDGKVATEFRQLCKTKGALILGHHWLSERHIVFVTDVGCELYLVNGHRRTAKLLKSVSLSVNWFSHHPPSKLFIFASGISNNVLTCMSFQNNTAHNIGRFELDFGKSALKPRLLERDIAVASIYGRLCLLALKFEPSTGFVVGLQIFDFQSPDGQPQPPKWRCTLRLELVGFVGVQVLDNLVLIHHKNAQQSLVFDIRISTERPLHCGPLWLHPKLAEKLGTEPAEASSFLYNSAWKMCTLGGLVVDMQLQLFTRVQLDLAKAVEQLSDDLEQTLQFLTNRSEADKVLLELVRRIVQNKELTFSRQIRLLRQILQDPQQANGAAQADATNTKPNSTSKWASSTPFTPLTVSHNSILRSVFEPLSQHADMDRRRLANLVVDFFLCLKQRKIQIQDQYMPELLLKIVADAKLWTCLQQLLQYRVIEDSKFLAFELISLSAECPALYQIALDMLARRGNSEQIAEVLLGRGHVLDALRFVGDEHTEVGGVRLDKLCLKMIGLAWLTGDRPLMFTVYSHLLTSGRLKALAESSNEDFERFSKEFELLYGEKEVSDAEQNFRLARLSSIRRRPNSGRYDSITSTAEDADQLLRDIQAEAGSSTSATEGEDDAGGDSSSTGT